MESVYDRRRTHYRDAGARRSQRKHDVAGVERECGRSIPQGEAGVGGRLAYNELAAGLDNRSIPAKEIRILCYLDDSVAELIRYIQVFYGASTSEMADYQRRCFESLDDPAVHAQRERKQEVIVVQKHEVLIASMRCGAMSSDLRSLIRLMDDGSFRGVSAKYVSRAISGAVIDDDYLEFTKRLHKNGFDRRGNKMHSVEDGNENAEDG